MSWIILDLIKVKTIDATIDTGVTVIPKGSINLDDHKLEGSKAGEHLQVLGNEELRLTNKGGNTVPLVNTIVQRQTILKENGSTYLIP